MNTKTNSHEMIRTIGSSYPRPDARDKVTGMTRFLTDLKAPGMVFAAPVVASIPFGRLRSINTIAAEKIIGFLGFISARDIPGKNQVGVIIPDQPLFVEDIIRYVGDSIGLAVADSPEHARQAADIIQVEYESWKPYFSIEASRTAGGPFIHESNLACEHRVRKGNVRKGFNAADYVIEAEFETPCQEHYYLEPQGCLVSPGEDGQVRVLGSLQCPFYVQKAVATALGIPLNSIQVEQAPTGGAFGGKEDIPSELCARAAVAARVLNRPVKIVYDRRQDIQLTSKRHPFHMHYKVAVSKEGKLLAAEVLLEENAGAYATLSTVVSYRAAVQALGPYSIPHVKVDSKSYYTNLPPNGAFRGFGSPQAAFGHERMMDIIAAKLNMDPLELRLNNIIRSGEETPTGQHLEVSTGAEETLRKAATASNWKEFRLKPSKDDRYLKGLGISTVHYGNCLGAAGWHMDGAGAKIQLQQDGSVSVSFGLVEMGQGAITVVVQMVAEALGIDPERVTVLPTSTNQVPDSGPSVASRNVVMTGNAIRDAAGKLLPILTEAAGELLECPADQIRITGDQVLDVHSDRSLGFTELADYLFRSNRPKDALGWWHVRELEFDSKRGNGEAYFTYSFATHVAEVHVDRLTGLVYVDRIWAAHDVGRVINPAGVEGQVEGGTAQGIGWALTEKFHYRDGKVVTNNLSTYLLPTVLDVASVETDLVEEPEPEGPWGAKGIGEPAIIPTAAAIANAVSNAVGAQIKELPLTPENVLDLIETKEKEY